MPTPKSILASLEGLDRASRIAAMASGKIKFGKVVSRPGKLGGGWNMTTYVPIPAKDLSKNERYTEEEIKLLRNRWSPSDTDDVAAWLIGGAAPDNKPACVPLGRSWF